MSFIKQIIKDELELCLLFVCIGVNFETDRSAL